MSAQVTVQRVSGAIAIIFGLVSVGAGASVLAGRDPGYLVFRPLVVFNTLMGLVYVAAGVLAWRRSRAAARIAAGIALVNLLVLGYIASLHRAGGGAAIDSVRAMGLRTGVWVALLLLLFWAARSSREVR